MAGPISDSTSLDIATRFCARRGPGWSVGAMLGTGGTAPVFEVMTPDGPLALKIYNQEFSSGHKGDIEAKRIAQQVELGRHTCASLVQIFDGGHFENRLYLLMSRASGAELEKRLPDVSRDGIRPIVHQVAEATLFLKQRDLCHRDIKSANIFVTDDFCKATLLDISVIRDIHDPIGIGTDHDGMLPIVATARYSPPEYLFRLIPPGPDLWAALSVYQLGALLHDLIMRVPLFQAEYATSSANRYRFAWLVATSMPTVDALDVDRDLLLLANRALDKDWRRRTTLSIEDFLLLDGNIRRRHALRKLGLNKEHTPSSISLTELVGRVGGAASAIEQSLSQYFERSGVRVTHAVTPGSRDAERVITLAWDNQEPNDALPTKYHFTIQLELRTTSSSSIFRIACALSCGTGRSTRDAQITLPETPDRAGVESFLATLIEGAFEQLAESTQKP